MSSVKGFIAHYQNSTCTPLEELQQVMAAISSENVLANFLRKYARVRVKAWDIYI